MPDGRRCGRRPRGQSRWCRLASGGVCPHCGAQWQGRQLFCPACGRQFSSAGDGPGPTTFGEGGSSGRRPRAQRSAAPERISVLVQPDADKGDGAGEDDAGGRGPGEQRPGDEPEEEPAEPGGCRRSATVLLVAGTVVMLIVGLGLAAVHYGLRDRSEIIQQTAEEHLNKGLSHLAQQDYDLAIAELELSLQLRPDDPAAAAALNEARQAVRNRPTATPAIRQDLNATYYEDLVAAYQAGEWGRVVDLADRLWSVDPEYRRDDVERMLFDCYYQTGLAYVEENRMEEAIRLFDRALRLRPGDPDAERQIELASLYSEGMTFWGANWEKVISSLSQLYGMAPSYHDVADRLYTAALIYGDLFAQQGDWCVAVNQYDRALAVYANADVAARRRECFDLCLAQPTATPEGTPGPEGWPTPVGPFVARVVEQTPIAEDKIYIRGHVLDRDGHGVASAVVKIQAWDWFVTHETDANGAFAFDGLDQPVTYTVSLADYGGASIEAPGEWGKITWVEFQESR